jgi:two-component system NtrC family sensor kinase
MRIRKKLIFLHSVFSLLLASILLVAVRPAVLRAVADAEGAIASKAALVASEGGRIPPQIAELVRIERGPVWEIEGARAGEPVPVEREAGWTWRGLIVGEGAEAEALLVGARLESARHATLAVYALLILSLVAVYGLIAVALEVFVLPRHVYGPIRALLAADEAVRTGDADRELVPESAMPADEMGEIMRSRNAAIRGVREQGRALSEALDQLETVATDLKRKNHLLENARRNLEGADRLMSLGMMSAGIAHELNTPLAVAKGLAEKLRADPGRTLSESEAELLGRVIGRLERLSDGLLDFARAREPAYAESSLASIVDEAVTLVRLDREVGDIEIGHDVDRALVLECDADRMVQVFVNLVRNAVDAVRAGRGGGGSPAIDVSAEVAERDGTAWVTILVRDTGPGIDPDLLPTLFDPFVSTRLDSKGTGLGLAVAEGIVREHAGTIIARNRRDTRGAVFEIVLPREAARAGTDGEGPGPGGEGGRVRAGVREAGG